MPHIIPISALKDYSEVLRLCDDDAPVFLTMNGHGKYVMQSIRSYEKLQTTVKLLAELAKGVSSFRPEDKLTVDEAFSGLEDN